MPDCEPFCSRCELPRCKQDQTRQISYQGIRAGVRKVYCDALCAPCQDDWIVPVEVKEPAREKPAFGDARPRELFEKFHRSYFFLHDSQTTKLSRTESDESNGQRRICQESEGGKLQIDPPQAQKKVGS